MAPGAWKSWMRAGRRGGQVGRQTGVCACVQAGGRGGARVCVRACVRYGRAGEQMCMRAACVRACESASLLACACEMGGAQKGKRTCRGAGRRVGSLSWVNAGLRRLQLEHGFDWGTPLPNNHKNLGHNGQPAPLTAKKRGATTAAGSSWIMYLRLGGWEVGQLSAAAGSRPSTRRTRTFHSH